MERQADIQWMRSAIALSQNARYLAPPNPWVGCVIVRDGQLIGQGHTQRVGEAHAEVVALGQAGDRAQSATVYVTLEPCSHYGKTPPCITALIAAGVKRVVVGLVDADARNRGCGIQRLREAGIEVQEGVCQDEIARSLRSYTHHRTTGRPFCLMKVAVSIDGRIAAEDGSSRWISSEEARMDAHQLRAEAQAILIGSGTALRDHPALTIRHGLKEDMRQPLRVVLDRRGRVSPEGPLFDVRQAPTLLISTHAAPLERRRAWQEAGAEVVLIENGLDMQAVFNLLGSRGILQLLVEGGAQLQSSLLSAGLVNQYTVYFGACLLGDCAVPLVKGLPIHSISEAIRWQLAAVQQLGSTIRADYVTCYSSSR